MTAAIGHKHKKKYLYCRVPDEDHDRRRRCATGIALASFLFVARCGSDAIFGVQWAISYSFFFALRLSVPSYQIKRATIISIVTITSIITSIVIIGGKEGFRNRCAIDKGSLPATDVARGMR